jgi:hypothetical protein
MIEKAIEKNGEKIVEVRSDGGKLLFIKTKQGYEMKCPRTKKICLVSYKEMYSDCLSCWADVPSGQNNPLFGEFKKNNHELRSRDNFHNTSK